MKHLSFLLLILFPAVLFAQEKDDELQNLSLDELMNVKTGVITTDIEVNKEDVNKGNTINLGLILPYSFYNLFSKEFEDAVQIAVDEINESGGVLSKKLVVIPADDGGDKIESIKKANQLAKDYNVSAFIGPTGSSRVVQVANKVAVPNRICLFTSGASSSSITYMDDNDLVWRVTPIDYQESTYAANFIVNSLNKKQIGIIYVTNDYGKSLYTNLVKDFQRLGADVTSVLKYSSLVDYQTFDLKSRLDSFFVHKPEIIYLITNPYEGSIITQRIEEGKYLESDYKPLFFSCSSNRGNDFLDNSSELILESMYGISQRVSTKPDFTKKFKEKHNYLPSTPEASGAYDIVYLLAYSMLYANSCNSEDYIKYLRRITWGSDNLIGINEYTEALKLIEQKININYDGASGKLEFDNNGDISNPEFEIWRIKDNQFEVMK